MAKMEERIASTIGQMLETKLEGLTTRMEGSIMRAVEASLEEKFNARIAAIEKQVEGLHTMGADDAPPSKKHKLGASSDASTRRSSSAGPSSATPSERLNDARRVWVVGFGRKLMKKDLDKKAHEIVGKVLPTADGAKVNIDARNLREVVAIDFHTHAEALDFVKAARVHDLSWDDTRSGESKQLRVRMDKTLAERRLGKLMSRMWAKCQEHLKEKGKWESGLHLGTHGGSLYIRDADDEIYVILEVRTTMSDSLKVKDVVKVAADMKKWEITDGMVDKWVADAVAMEGPEWL